MIKRAYDSGRVAGFSSKTLLMTAASLAALSLLSTQASAQDQTSTQTNTSAQNQTPPQGSTASQAQTNNTDDASSDEPVDEVVVTGFRASIQDALDTKRRADSIVDAISAEDVGKSTDQNIAEALQRVTGVVIDRSDGEGTTIGVRGAGANLTGVSLNGVPLTSSGDNQAVNLSQFSSDLLSSIEVVKTSSANQNEGSLGGAVILKGFEPLNSKRDRRSIEIQGRYTDLADKSDDFEIADDIFGGDRKFNLSFSDKFANDTIGISLVASSETQTTRKDEVFNADLAPYVRATNPINRNSDGTVGFYNSLTGDVIQTYDYGDGLGERTLIPLIPRTVNYQVDRVERDRDSISGVFQYSPDDDTNLVLSATYTVSDVDRELNQLTFSSNQLLFQQDTPDGDPNFFVNPDNYTITAASNVVSGRRGRPISQRNRTTIDNQTQENLVLGAKFEKTFGDFFLSIQGGQSQTTQGDSFRVSGSFQPSRNRNGFFNGLEQGYDCGPDFSLCRIIITEGFVDDPTNYEFSQLSLLDRDNEDKIQSLFVDTEWDKSFGPISSLEFGLKYTNRDKLNRSDSKNLRNDASPELINSTLADFRGVDTPSDFGEALGLPRDHITDGFPSLDLNAALDLFQEAAGDPTIGIERGRDVFSDINEQVFGGYVQANYEVAEGRVTGNFGARLVQTKIDTESNVIYDLVNGNFTTDANIDFFGSEADVIASLGPRLTEDPNPVRAVGKNDYTNLLPSFNLNWLAHEDMIVRLAASQTMARPTMSQIRPSFLLNENQFRQFSIGRAGNPNLKPFLSTNLDASFEWYFKRGSLFSVALFNKDLKDSVDDVGFASFYSSPLNVFYDADGNLLAEDQVNFDPDFNSILLPAGSGGLETGCFANREEDLSVAGRVSDEVCDTILVQQPLNLKGGYVRGVELSLQHNFTELPGLLSGLGFIANYTYSDSRQDEDSFTIAGFDVLVPESPLVGTSEHTANTTVFYEKGDFLLRLAYNYRSDYLRNRLSANGETVWVEGFDTVDLSGAWDITDNVTLNFQAINLTDTVTREYATIGGELDGIPFEPLTLGDVNTTRTKSLSNTGTTFRVGVRFNF